MVIYEYPDTGKAIPEKSSGCVLALGFFDGVHEAHRHLLKAAREKADSLAVSLGVFTFRSDSAIKGGGDRLYGDGEKADLLAEAGADFAVFADFSAVSVKSPEEFVKTTLISELGCIACVAGYNFRFGKGAAADSDKLISLMADAGREAIICQEVSALGEAVSTTRIKKLLSLGRVKEANRLLGSPYFIRGSVSHGKSEGGKMGYPTVNIKFDEGRFIPKFGVYSSRVNIDNKTYRGLTNVGTCPTLGEREAHLETFILDFKGDLYGKKLDIFLLDYIREEKHFSSAEELKMQINIDKNKIIKDLET